jgi:hypothetical protein
VLKIRHEQLRIEVQMGLDQIKQGEIAALDIASITRKARDHWEALQRS